MAFGAKAFRRVPPPPPLLRLEESLPRNEPDTDGFRLESANPSNHTFPGARPFQHARVQRPPLRGRQLLSLDLL